MTNTPAKRDMGKKKQDERTKKLHVKRDRVAIGPTPPLDVTNAFVSDDGIEKMFPTGALQQLFLDKFCGHKAIVEHPISLLDFTSNEFSFFPPILKVGVGSVKFPLSLFILTWFVNSTQTSPGIVKLPFLLPLS
jgi:hypothetical protein